ncbi:hypothetical protein CBL_10069 [Carabus blaptoides fortunei]
MNIFTNKRATVCVHQLPSKDELKSVQSLPDSALTQAELEQIAEEMMTNSDDDNWSGEEGEDTNEYIITLVKARQVTDEYLKRKKEAFKITMLGHLKFSPEFTSEDMKNIWIVIDYHLKKTDTTIKYIVDNVRKLLEDVDIVAITALAGH